MPCERPAVVLLSCGGRRMIQTAWVRESHLVHSFPVFGMFVCCLVASRSRSWQQIISLAALVTGVPGKSLKCRACFMSAALFEWPGVFAHAPHGACQCTLPVGRLARISPRCGGSRDEIQLIWLLWWWGNRDDTTGFDYRPDYSGPNPACNFYGSRCIC